MLYRVLFSVFLLLSLTACEEDTTPKITKADLEIIDTLYLEKLKTFRPYLDSICDAQLDSLVAIAVDSMLIKRMEEIEKQRSRYKLD